MALQGLKVQLFTTDAASPTPKMPSEIGELLGKPTGKLGTALLCASYESRRFGSGAIHPEHLLLGLVFVSSYVGGPPATGRSLGSIALLREEVSTMFQSSQGEGGTVSSEAQRTLRYAAEEAALLGHETVGTAHLLLALLRMEDSFPFQYLNRVGIELPATRSDVAAADLA
jgi:ATP-dependent Clp protease ATP-binding subunit ClpC